MIKLKSMALVEQKNPEYNSRVWNGLGDKDRYDALASVNDDEGPDYADEYMYENDWFKIPNEITRHINLTQYKDKMLPLNHATKLDGAEQVIAFMGEMKKIGKRNKVTKRRGGSRLPKNVRVEQEYPGIFCSILQDTSWYWQARGNYSFPGMETLENYNIYAYDRYHTQIKEIANKIRSYYANKNDSAGDIGTVSESKKMKKAKNMKNTLAENMKRFGTKNLNEDAINYEDLEIKVNHVLYETNYHTITWNTQGDLTDEYFVKETIEQVIEQVEDENIRDEETGEYKYDVTRILDGKIEFDCEVTIDGYEIDVRAEYDADGTLQNIEIQDPHIADKVGLTDQILYDLLF